MKLQCLLIMKGMIDRSKLREGQLCKSASCSLVAYRTGGCARLSRLGFAKSVSLLPVDSFQYWTPKFLSDNFLPHHLSTAYRGNPMIDRLCAEHVWFTCTHAANIPAARTGRLGRTVRSKCPFHSRRPSQTLEGWSRPFHIASWPHYLQWIQDGSRRTRANV